MYIQYIYRVFQKQLAKLQEHIPLIIRMKKSHINIGSETLPFQIINIFLLYIYTYIFYFILIFIFYFILISILYFILVFIFYFIFIFIFLLQNLLKIISFRIDAYFASMSQTFKNSWSIFSHAAIISEYFHSSNKNIIHEGLKVSS